jgi:hypothetical protein
VTHAERNLSCPAGDEMSSHIPTLDEWVEMTHPHFEFLVEWGFRPVPVRVDPAVAAWGPRVQYLSDSMGVQLHCSLEFDRVETSIIRLVEGRVPPYPIFIKDGDEVYWFRLDGLLALYDPERGTECATLAGLDEDALQRQLGFIAETLRDDGDALLDASSKSLRLLQQQIHEHARAHPPTVRIHLPADATADEVAQAVSESRKSFPGIEVQVDRYR